MLGTVPYTLWPLACITVFCKHQLIIWGKKYKSRLRGLTGPVAYTCNPRKAEIRRITV
jgi:hypothetical protein